MTVALAALAGALIGGLVGLWTLLLIRRARRDLGLPAVTPKVAWGYWLATLALSVVAVSLLRWATLAGWQASPEVVPTSFGGAWRFALHVLLLEALIVATLVDLDCYVIPDETTVPLALAAMLMSALVGELQLAHLWVDWRDAIDQLRGPTIPGWYDQWRWLHGLAISLTGAAVGVALALVTRSISRFVIGSPALGFGDVTLLLLLGSVMGWQPVLVTFLLAPLLGLAVGLALKMSGQGSYLPYGPFLSLSAAIVLLGWGSIWSPLRLPMSDPLLIAAVAVVLPLGTLLLLSLASLYRSIPGRSPGPLELPSRLRTQTAAMENPERGVAAAEPIGSMDAGYAPSNAPIKPPDSGPATAAH